MKIALVSSGLGNIWRGYERFTHELFHLLKDELDITLFKGGGSARFKEVVLWNLKRDGLLRRTPLVNEQRPRRSAYYFEALSFFLSLVPHLKRGGFDLVHVTDAPLVNFFYHARKRIKINSKILWSNGNPLVGQSSARADYLHQLTPDQVETMVNDGVAPTKIFLIPFGAHDKGPKNTETAARMREHHGIPKNKIVILALSGINRSHKRIDYLIHEVAQLGPDYFLFVAGHVEDASLKREAKEFLGDRFKFVHVPFDKADALYHLADIFVMTSLVEGFGLALVEAMLARVPVIAHTSRHYRWMVGDERCLADLGREKNLSAQIVRLAKDPKLTREIVKRNHEHASRNYEWSVLKGKYLDLYARISQQLTRRKVVRV
jgi:1,2-diacylglycerol 3-alpha-glucosyltransferase